MKIVNIVFNLFYIYVLPLLLALFLEYQYPKLGWSIHVDYYAAVGQILAILFIGFYIESSLFSKVRKSGVKNDLVLNFVLITLMNEAVCLYVLATHHSSTFTFIYSVIQMALLILMLIVYNDKYYLGLIEKIIETNKLLRK